MLDQIASFWHQLPYDQRYSIWLCAGLLSLSFLLFFNYRLIRYALGHRRFRGEWYNEADYQLLIERVIERQKYTSRVLDPDELEIIRKHLRVQPRFSHRSSRGGI